MIFKDDVAAPEVVIRVTENIAYFFMPSTLSKACPKYSVIVVFCSIFGTFIQNGLNCYVNVPLKVHSNI